MGLVDYAEAELRRAGLFDADADYGGAIGPVVLDLVKKFASEGHSGDSAALTLAAFDKVARFQPLTPLTSDPSEWMEVGGGFWQNRRAGSVFSADGGQTCYDLDKNERPADAYPPGTPRD